MPSKMERTCFSFNNMFPFCMLLTIHLIQQGVTCKGMVIPIETSQTFTCGVIKKKFTLLVFRQCEYMAYTDVVEAHKVQYTSDFIRSKIETNILNSLFAVT